MTARVLNLARLERKLKQLPAAAIAEIRKEMAGAADEIVAMMKSLVAVRDGDLRDSIGWTWGKKPKGSSVIAVVQASLASDLTITIHAGDDKAYHARWVEYGTRPHAVGKGSDLSAGSRKQSGGMHPGMKAQPFFMVSWRANRRNARRKVRAGVRKAARIVAGSP